jgi:hypothetical protein
MKWFTDKVSALQTAVETEKINRSHLAVKSVCIHGEEDCARCMSDQLNDSTDYVWQNLEEDDIKRVIYMLPEEVREMMKRHPGKVIVAGGFIRALVAGEDIKDLDIFVPSESEAKKWCDEVDIEYEMGDKYLSTEPNEYFNYEIQTVWRYPFKEAYEIPEQFDYTVVKCAIWFDPGDKNKSATFVGICHERFYRDLARKALVFCCERNAEKIMSIPRLLRYTQYGYSMDPKSMAEVILKTCLGLNLTNGFEGAFQQLENAYQPHGDDADWSLMTKPYVKPKKKKKKKSTARVNDYVWGS